MPQIKLRQIAAVIWHAHARHQCGEPGFIERAGESGEADRQRQLALRGFFERDEIGARRLIRRQLRQHLHQRAAGVEHVEHCSWRGFHQSARKLPPDALRHQGIDFATRAHAAHQRQRLRRNGKTEARRETRAAQDAHRVFGEGRADVAQNFGLQIIATLIRVDESTCIVDCHRIDGEVAARQVLLQRDIRCGMKLEARIAWRGLAFGAREGVLVVGLRMQKYREVAADRLETLVHQRFRRGTYNHEVTICDRQPEQFISHRAADAVDFHGWSAS